MGNTLYRRKAARQGLSKITRYFVNRYLHLVAQRHHAHGFPQMAVFSHDHIGHLINLDGRYEEDHLQAAMGWLRQQLGETKDRIALDIGANIGNHAVFFSQFFRSVHAVEPNPRTYQLLRFNAGNVGNVIAHQLGLSDAAAVGALHENPTNIGGTYINLEADEGLSVSLETLDDFAVRNQLDAVALIKIDTEGFEARILRGAKNVIAAYMPVIMFELSPSDFSADGSSEVVSLLMKQGYNFVTVEQNFSSGGSLLGRAISYALRTLFGDEYLVRPITAFEPKFYQMVIAVHSRIAPE